jgi:hypothetical protein
MHLARLLAFACMLGTAAPAIAADSDMHLGSFDTLWCNYHARIDVQSQDPGTWVFRGKILIFSTGQYDPVWIEQYQDLSLRVIRYLQGPMLGETQVVQTHPPEEVFLSSGRRFLFRGKRGYGFGCDGTRSDVYLKP